MFLLVLLLPLEVQVRTELFTHVEQRVVRLSVVSWANFTARTWNSQHPPAVFTPILQEGPVPTKTLEPCPWVGVQSLHQVIFLWMLGPAFKPSLFLAIGQHIGFIPSSIEEQVRTCSVLIWSYVSIWPHVTELGRNACSSRPCFLLPQRKRLFFRRVLIDV